MTMSGDCDCDCDCVYVFVVKKTLKQCGNIICNIICNGVCWVIHKIDVCVFFVCFFFNLGLLVKK